MPKSTPIFAGDKYGNSIPILPVSYGNSTERAITTTAINATVAHDNTDPIQLARVWAIDCGAYYRFGDASVAVPTVADAYLPAGLFMDIPLTNKQTHFRAVAKSGSGFFRVELLGV